MDRWQYFLLLGKVILYLLPFLVGGYIWSYTHKISGNRGIFTYAIHWLIILTGWFLDKVNGLIFISLPLLVFYYYLLIHLALVVVPASDPISVREWILRILYFFWYTWGFQYPGRVVPGPASRLAETRIQGRAYKRLFSPGLIWARSHQVVGITSGISFSRIKAPGTVFTKVFERPIDGVVDLRTQLRTFWIDVVSSDGIPYKALLFTSFVVDREKWEVGIAHRLARENRLLKDASEPDYKKGSFPISRLRIRTLLSATGIHSSFIDQSIKEPANKTPAKKDQPKKDPPKPVPADKNQTKPEPTYWDELVMYHVEKAASEVLSQRRFDELWLPAEDCACTSASDDIAEKIRNRCFFDLLCRGVRFFSCRLVNFEFTRDKLKEPGEVERQHIAAWQADWQRDTTEVRAQGQAEAELVQQDARAFAYASLLTAIAQGLQGTGQLVPKLHKNLIAMRFVGALEEILQRQPDGGGKNAASEAINTWKRGLLPDSPRR